MADVLVEILWKRGAKNETDSWPELPLTTLRELAAETLGYPVPSSSVRSTVYNHPYLFDRVVSPRGVVSYRLSEPARRGVGSRDVDKIAAVRRQ